MKRKNLVLLYILLLIVLYLFCGSLSLSIAKIYVTFQGDYSFFTKIWVNFLKILGFLEGLFYFDFVWLLIYIVIAILFIKNCKETNEKQIDMMNLILSFLVITLLIIIFSPLNMFFS